MLDDEKVNLIMGKLDALERNLEANTEITKDIGSQILKRLINLSAEVRAISARQDIIDYNTQWVHDELTRKE